MTSSHTPLWPDNPNAQDLLGFADIAEPIQEALLRERLDPVAVGVFGDWGSGKSTVLEILRKRLNERGRVVVGSFTRDRGSTTPTSTRRRP